FEYVKVHPVRVALQRIAVSAASTIGPDDELAGPDDLGRNRRQSGLCTLAVDFCCIWSLSRTASTNPFWRVNTPIQRIDHGHWIALGPEHAVPGGRSAKPAGATRIGLQADRMEPNRVFLLVNFHAVAIADSASHREQIGNPSVRTRSGGASVVA